MKNSLINKTLLKVLVLCLLGSLLTACGQSGSLYLPHPDPHALKHQQAPLKHEKT